MEVEDSDGMIENRHRWRRKKLDLWRHHTNRNKGASFLKFK